MIIDKNEVGSEFYEELVKMINIRKERRKIYHDTYLEDTLEFLLLQIENKIKRIKMHIQNSTELNSIEKAEDNALDIGNYSLFLAAILKK